MAVLTFHVGSRKPSNASLSNKCSFMSCGIHTALLSCNSRYGDISDQTHGMAYMHKRPPMTDICNICKDILLTRSGTAKSTGVQG